MVAMRKQASPVSVVTMAPCASRFGSNTTRIRAIKPAPVQNISRTERKTTSASKTAKIDAAIRARKMT